jgi:hypothetical protein
MKRILLAAMAVALLGGCRGGTEGGADRPGEGQSALITVGGTISEASPDRITVVTTEGQPVQLQIADDAQIMQDENRVQRDRLQEGASVRASYREEGGRKFAQRIDIDSSAGSPRSPSVVPGTRGMDTAQPQKQAR